MLTPHRVYIIGFMGSGKSTAGKKLASLLGWSFIDLDRKIEEITGKTIPEIFAVQGEEYFREVESGTLKFFDSQVDTVISAGGGSPCFSDNMDFMLRTGLTIYLKLTPEQLNSRLAKSSGKRPLIKGLSSKELLDYIIENLSIRENWYNRADIILEGMNADINLLKSLVIESLDI